MPAASLISFPDLFATESVRDLQTRRERDIASGMKQVEREIESATKRKGASKKKQVTRNRVTISLFLSSHTPTRTYTHACMKLGSRIMSIASHSLFSLCFVFISCHKCLIGSVSLLRQRKLTHTQPTACTYNHTACKELATQQTLEHGNRSLPHPHHLSSVCYPPFFFFSLYFKSHTHSTPFPLLSILK